MAKARTVKLQSPNSLRDYLSLFNDNDEIDIRSQANLLSNWAAVESPLITGWSGINDRKNLRSKFLSWLSHGNFDSNKAESMMSILRTLDSLRLDSARRDVVNEAIPRFDTAGTDDLNVCIQLMHNNKIPLTKDDNLKHLMAKTPEQLKSIRSILETLAPLKLDKARYKAVVDNIDALDSAYTDHLIVCLGLMHNNKISLTEGDNLAQVMAKADLLRPLLEALDPLDKQRFQLVKNLVNDGDPTILSFKSDALVQGIQALQKHKLPLASNLPRLSGKMSTEIEAISGLITAIKKGELTQSRFNKIMMNASCLTTGDELIDDDEEEQNYDSAKIQALAKHINLMSQTGISLIAGNPGRLDHIMHLPANQIQGINELISIVQRGHTANAALSARQYDVIVQKADVLENEENKQGIVSTMALVRTITDISDDQLTSLIENNPVPTQDLLRHLNSEEKPVSKARINLVLRHAGHLSQDKMPELKRCIDLLEENKIPLSKNNNLGKLMQLDAQQLGHAADILDSLTKVTPERFAIVIDNLHAFTATDTAQLANCLSILEEKNAPLSKHNTLKTLMSMTDRELDRFNGVLSSLNNTHAPGKAYQAIATKLPELKANPEKMPALSRLISDMGINQIPFVAGFFDKLFGRKDNITQLSTLSKGRLKALTEDLKADTFNANLGFFKAEEKADRVPAGRTGAMEEMTNISLQSQSDEDGSDDESLIKP